MKETSLKIEWSQLGTAEGILRAIIKCDDIEQASARKLKLEINRHRIDFEITPMSFIDNMLWINVHTHLIANGSTDFSIEIETEFQTIEAEPCQFNINNSGQLAERVRGSLLKNNTPLAFLGHCDSGRYDYQDAALFPWFDAPDAEKHIQSLLAAGSINDAEARAMADFVNNGYIVLDDKLTDNLLDAACLEIDKAIDEKYQGYEYGSSQRLEQLHHQSDAIRDIWLHPKIHRMLGLLFSEKSQPCQSLVYVFGSQQDAHQDSIHLTPFPAGYMCGVWVALEDVKKGSGELVVYPGSHRLPRVRMKAVDCKKVAGDWQEFGQKVVTHWADLLKEHKLEPVPYFASRGSVLIWHENLMHAGSIRSDISISRRSMVTHNFARGSLVYYDSTGMAGISYAI